MSPYPHPIVPAPVSAPARETQTIVLTPFSHVCIHPSQPWPFSLLPSSFFLFSPSTPDSVKGGSLQWLLSTRGAHRDSRNSNFHSLIIFMKLGLRSKQIEGQEDKERISGRAREGHRHSSPERVNQWEDTSAELATGYWNLPGKVPLRSCLGWGDSWHLTLPGHPGHTLVHPCLLFRLSLFTFFLLSPYSMLRFRAFSRVAKNFSSRFSTFLSSGFK